MVQLDKVGPGGRLIRAATCVEPQLSPVDPTGFFFLIWDSVNACWTWVKMYFGYFSWAEVQVGHTISGQFLVGVGHKHC